MSLLTPFSALRADSSLIAQAENAWRHRERAGQTERAIALWEQAWKSDPSHPEVLIDLARAAGRAYRHARSKAEKKRWSERQRDFGAEAVAKNPKSSEAYTEYAAALGQWADSHRGIRALKAVRDAIDTLKKAITLKPENATAHMLLAQFYGEAPKTFSVGDPKAALDEARLAVQYGPERAINHLVLAKRFLAEKERDAAIRELNEAVNLTPPPDLVPETRADQADARALLAKLGAPATPARSSASGAAALPLVGESCTDSSQCEGACVADSAIPAGSAATGTCQPVQTDIGACTNRVETGKATGTSCGK